MIEHNCRVCGLYRDTPPWGEDGESPTYEICPCCNVEFGYEDYTVESVKKFREKWIQSGAAWLEEESKPLNWNSERQLEDVPERFK